MRTALIIVLCIHILAGVFWAGTSFTLTRSQGQGAERLFRPQMGAALVSIAAGGYLWSVLHPSQWFMVLGASGALIAFGVQGGLGGLAVRRLRKGAIAEPVARGQLLLAQRAAAALLALTIITMAASRYV